MHLRRVRLYTKPGAYETWPFLTKPEIGLHWIAPNAWLDLIPKEVMNLARRIFGVASVLAPLILFVRVRVAGVGPMPLIVPLLLISNAIRWYVLTPLHAFLWATVFHGIQYLAIVTIFHVKEQLAQPGNQGTGSYHALRFYALSLALGYSLFCVLPEAYVLAGFGKVESLLLVTGAINIHHFVVDAFIWRLRKKDPNRRIVEGNVPAAIPS